MNPLEIIQEIQNQGQYQTFLCFEAGKKNRIFILANEAEFYLIFKIDNGEYTSVRKTVNDVKAVLISASKSVGFEAKVAIEFRDLSNAIFRIKNRFAAIELCSRILSIPFNPDEPFTYCNAIQDRAQIIGDKINIDSAFAKNLRAKRVRLSLLILFICLIVFSIAITITMSLL